jgi:hypothetical protein
MNTFDLIDIAFTALERRKTEKPSPDVANCDVCDEEPGERTIFFAGTETWVCEHCAEEHRPRRRFRSTDERDAYEAGVRSRGEI